MFGFCAFTNVIIPIILEIPSEYPIGVFGKTRGARNLSDQ
jgi:hypothetical protein